MEVASKKQPKMKYIIEIINKNSGTVRLVLTIAFVRLALMPDITIKKDKICAPITIIRIMEVVLIVLFIVIVK